MKRRSPSSSKAFTLVELLVVVGIIALLVSILMPALGKARRQAVRTQCLANLKQIITATAAYAADNKGWFPARPGYPAAGTYSFVPGDTGWDYLPQEVQKTYPRGPKQGQVWWDLNETFIKPYLKVRDKLMFCPAQWEARNPTMSGYDVKQITYAYYNVSWPTYQWSVSKPDISRQGKKGASYPLWGCLTIRQANDVRWAHEGYTKQNDWKAMNAVFMNGSGQWVTGKDVEMFFKQTVSSNNEFYWPKQLPPG